MNNQSRVVTAARQRSRWNLIKQVVKMRIAFIYVTKRFNRKPLLKDIYPFVVHLKRVKILTR